MARLAEWIISKRWLVLVTIVSLGALAASGVRFIEVNNDYHVFFGKENPQLIAFDGLHDKYTKDDNVFIVIQPESGHVFTKETLSAVEELTNQSWQTPFSSRVDAITNFQHTYAEGDEMFVENLVDEIHRKSDADIEKIKQVALKDPLLVDRLLDKKGTLTAVNITVNLPGEALTENREVAAFVNKMVTEWEQKHPGIKTHLTGNIMFTNAFDENFEVDMMTLTPIMFLVILICLVLATRNIGVTISTFIILIFSMATAMGMAGWLGIQLSGPVFSAPNMILTLAIADSIHLLITIMQQMRLGISKKEAIIESFRLNFMPVFVTSLTTVIGFLALNFSDTPPFRDLGNITAMGVVAAFFFSMFLLPILISFLPFKVKVQKEKSSLWLERFSDFLIKRRKPVLWGASAFVIIFAVFSANNILNNEFIKFFDKSVKFRTDSDFINDNLTGMYTIEFSLGAGGSDGITNPKYLNKVDDFGKWFETQENVVHVNSLVEVMKRVNKSMHGDNTDYYRLPTSSQEAAQYLLLYEMSLPYGLDLNNQINVDKSESRFIATVKNVSSQELINLSESAENWLANNAPEYMSSKGISMALMFSHITKRNMSSMLKGGLIALVLISFILIFALRSLKYGLISLIPNLAPIAVAFGFWGLVNGQIDMGISIVFGMTMGLVVDDTIHLLSKYIRARREHGKSPEDAIRYAFSTVGRAVIITTLVLTAGFLVLAQSQFGFNAGMAKLTAITIVIALILDMVLLPTILLAFDNKIARIDDNIHSNQTNHK